MSSKPKHAEKTEEVSKSPVKIFLVDDHQVVRQGTREMITAHPELTVVSELGVGDSQEIANLLKLRPVDILLLDINLPGENGLQILEKLKPQFPALKIILFSAFTENAYVQKAVQLHANGYLSKTIDKLALQQALLEVSTSDTPVYSSDIQQVLIKPVAETTEKPPDLKLTARELEILKHVAQGKTNQAIADEFVLSVKTVDSHVANLLKKLGMAKRTQLVAFAYEKALL